MDSKRSLLPRGVQVSPDTPSEAYPEWVAPLPCVSLFTLPSVAGRGYAAYSRPKSSR